MILLIDNYDSFTYNLYQLCRCFITPIKIVRNDKISLKEIISIDPQAIILSPGPKSPYEAGICMEVIDYFSSHIPILGVCLGMQAIGATFGATIVPAPFPIHGKTSIILHNSQNLYQNLPQNIKVGRYHSLMIEKKSIPQHLVIDAVTKEGIIMGVRHRQFPCYGVQFHPESILTEYGDLVIKNFFDLCLTFKKVRKF